LRRLLREIELLEVQLPATVLELLAALCHELGVETELWAATATAEYVVPLPRHRRKL
jgi:hypothetical protein